MSEKNEEVQVNSSDLPPKRERKMLRSVSPPLSNTPMHRFNYYIALFAIILLGFYSWRMLQWKSEAGGWWNLALGKRPPGAEAMQGHGSHGANSNPGTYSAPPKTEKGKEKGRISVEDRINDLAAALGMPSTDLAAAIADVVREHVPPSSLSSLAAHEPSGTAVQYLVNPDAATEQESMAGAGVGVVTNAFDAIIGFDEPPNEFV